MNQDSVAISSQLTVHLDAVFYSKTGSPQFGDPAAHFNLLAIKDRLSKVIVDMGQNKGMRIPVSLGRANTHIHQVSDPGCLDIGKDRRIVNVPKNIDIPETDLQRHHVAKTIHNQAPEIVLKVAYHTDRVEANQTGRLDLK
jgi:hypothetical protein